jgi:FkbM family methyltransferase
MGSMKNIIKRRLTKLAASIYDPLVSINVGNQELKTPLSHPLKELLRAFPQINFNLPRIIKYIADKEKDVKVIDVGANIGDTVAFIKNYTDAPVLCIDGDEHYLNILKKNVAKYNNVSVVHSLVGAENKEVNFELKKERGTAYIVDSSEKKQINTLENILEQNPGFKDSRVLKIDTDGFDTIILKGSPNYLKSKQPILFFEFDPYLATKNNDDPFTLIPFLKECGYGYLMFYISNGDFLLSCEIGDTELVNQVIHYFSGRNVELYTDICAFPVKDRALFETITKEEIAHFKKVRNY